MIAVPKPTKEQRLREKAERMKLKAQKVRKRIKKASSIGKLKKRYEDIIKLQAKERDGWICQHCGKKVEGLNAHGSHVIPVSASQLLRFDIQNIKCLCYHCHINWWHKNPLEASKWFEEKFPERYKYLQEHRYDIKQWTRIELLEILSQYENHN